MKKVIALIRTSTAAQEVDSQRQELIEYIKQDGIAEEDIITVGQAGASAIKVDAAYQKNLQTVYSLIDGGDIGAVYAWAIDRIGRNEIQLFTFKDKLVTNRIQLIIKNPSLRLLNDDGSVNTGTELAFSLFATMARQEMENKKVRFARAKKRNAEQGIFNGGLVHYGYEVAEDGKIMVNGEEAETVKLIFTLYGTGEYSITKLVTELQARGIKVRGKAVSIHFITFMLRSTAFVGYTVHKNVRRVYPRIISDGLFKRVQDKLAENRKGGISKQSKHTHLATKLIVCPDCGRHWYASNRVYKCISSKYRAVTPDACPNRDCISIEWLDVAAWYVAKTEEIRRIQDFTADKAAEAERQIEVNGQKIRTLEDKVAKAGERRERIATMYIEGDITQEQQQRQSARLKQDVAAYKSEITKLEEDNKKLAGLVNADNEGVLIKMGRLPVSGIYEEAEEAYRITHRHLKQVTVEPYLYNGKHQKMITITTVLGDVKRFLYVAKSKAKENGTVYKLLQKTGDGSFEPLVATPDFVPFEL